MSYTDKQLQIMKVAESLFSTAGYDGTSVRQIADAAGVNLAMISYYFGSKEKLIEAIVESKSETLKEKVEAMLKQDIPSIEKMYEIAENYIEKLTCNAGFTRMMMSDQLLQQSPTVHASLMNLKKKNGKLVQELIKQGQEKGEFKEDIDVLLVLSVMIGFISHAMSNIPFYVQFHNFKVAKKDQDNLLKDKLRLYLRPILKSILINEK